MLKFPIIYNKFLHNFKTLNIKLIIQNFMQLSIIIYRGNFDPNTIISIFKIFFVGEITLWYA